MSSKAVVASPHKMSESVRSVTLARLLSAEGKIERPRRNASLGHATLNKKNAMRNDLESATTKAMKLKRAIENVWTHKANIPNEMYKTMEESIHRFFGCYPEEDTEWSHNLWSGSFYPIIAFFGTYDIGAMSWGSKDIKSEVVEGVKLIKPDLGVTYVMATVYGKLGEKSLEALELMDREKVLDRVAWDAIKHLQLPSFDTCESKKEIYHHVAALIRQDRVLRKVKGTVIPDIEPWKSSARFFLNRPSSNSLLSRKYIRKLVRQYQPALDETTTVAISRIIEESPTMNATEIKETKTNKLYLRATLEESSDYELISLAGADNEDDDCTENAPLEDDLSRDEQECDSFVSEDESTDDDDDDDGSHKLDRTKRDKPFKNRIDVDAEIQDMEDEEALLLASKTPSEGDPESDDAGTATSEVAAILGGMKQIDKGAEKVPRKRRHEEVEDNDVAAEDDDVAAEDKEVEYDVAAEEDDYAGDDVAAADEEEEGTAGKVVVE